MTDIRDVAWEKFINFHKKFQKWGKQTKNDAEGGEKSYKVYPSIVFF
jgi:hypothetical protein